MLLLISSQMIETTVTLENFACSIAVVGISIFPIHCVDGSNLRGISIQGYKVFSLHLLDTNLSFSILNVDYAPT